jgi:hypothetical protein
MFTRESLLASDWYRARLLAKQQRDTTLWQRHVRYLDRFLRDESRRSDAARLGVARRRQLAASELARVSSLAYLDALAGTLGADPISTAVDGG